MRVLLCAVALTTAVAYVGASPLLGAKVVHENASPFGTRFNFGTGTTTAAATSAEHIHHQQFRPKRNMQQQQHHPVHLFRPVRQGGGMVPMNMAMQSGPTTNPGQGPQGPPAGMSSMRPPMAGAAKDGLFLQDTSFFAGGGGFGGGFGPGLGFGGFGGFGFPGIGGFGFPGIGGFGFPGIGGFGFPGPFVGGGFFG